ncbi:MAG: flotillin-like FloA family protein [Pirellulales bacterium]|nr:flotillin-like FloA family protein [Pirellulales bacterium]
MDFSQLNWPLAACAILFLLLGLIYLFIIFRFGGLWLQSYTSGVPVMIMDLIGMQFRRTDARAVVRSMIMAKQSGITLTRAEAEKAYQQGVDLSKITLALIHAKKQGLDLSFEQLVDADLEGKLEEKFRNDERYVRS